MKYLTFFHYTFHWGKFDDALMGLNTGTPKNINFPFGTYGRLMVLGVPILKNIGITNNL